MRNKQLFAAFEHPHLPTQSAMLLLRIVACSFGTYLARTLHPDVSHEALSRLDETVTRIARARLEFDDSTAFQAIEQVHMKIRHGGLGLQSNQIVAPFAFWASAAQAASVISRSRLQDRASHSRWLQSALEACWNSSPFAGLRARQDITTITPSTTHSADFLEFYSRIPPPRDDAKYDQERLPAEKLQRTLCGAYTKLHAAQHRARASAESRVRLEASKDPPPRAG
jgi:hypothetical protein